MEACIKLDERKLVCVCSVCVCARVPIRAVFPIVFADQAVSQLATDLNSLPEANPKSRRRAQKVLCSLGICRCGCLGQLLLSICRSL